MHPLQTTANPAPTRYHWKFVSSADVGRVERVVDDSLYSTEETESRLSWEVMGEEDYGEVECGGEKGAEGQPQPCRFIITPAVRSGPWLSCIMHHVSCIYPCR